MKLTKNFSKIEFESRDGATMPKDVLENVKILAENLQIIRDYIGEPLHINSGYRSPEHNKRIGGVPKSQHLLGTAADISSRNYTAKELVLIFKKHIENGDLIEGGLGLYNGFIHYDVRGTYTPWNQSSRYKNFF